MVLIAASSRFFTFFKTSAYTLKNTADERSASLIFVDHQSINLRVRAHRFINLYRNLNLISQDGNGLPVHRFCTNAAKCWDISDERFPPDDNKISHICQPWIGSEYEKLKLVVIGENLNEYGGIDSLIELTNEAKDLIAEGYRRVHFHSTFHEYAGSFLWHRLGCYSAAIGEAMGAMELLWEPDGYPNAENVAKAFDYMSFLEHIKCAPFGNNGRATTAMWENCGSHILRQELLLLKPTQLLVLGSSKNFWYLQKNVFDLVLDKQEFDSVIRVKVTVDNLKRAMPATQISDDMSRLIC